MPLTHEAMLAVFMCLVVTQSAWSPLSKESQCHVGSFFLLVICDLLCQASGFFLLWLTAVSSCYLWPLVCARCLWPMISHLNGFSLIWCIVGHNDPNQTACWFSVTHGIRLAVFIPSTVTHGFRLVICTFSLGYMVQDLGDTFAACDSWWQAFFPYCWMLAVLSHVGLLLLGKLHRLDGIGFLSNTTWILLLSRH